MSTALERAKLRVQKLKDDRIHTHSTYALNDDAIVKNQVNDIIQLQSRIHLNNTKSNNALNSQLFDKLIENKTLDLNNSLGASQHKKYARKLPSQRTSVITQESSSSLPESNTTEVNNLDEKNGNEVEDTQITSVEVKIFFGFILVKNLKNIFNSFF
ncbi:hypothetical protein HK099_003402 [Clydaea vesicula]|uniref:Uncharacterized protein n=1 Tax=Clydaea vesicula TaxID=447962 RepID=A0AAD5U3F2_9FUNG|nr:hypothetical protein HK099_003402 [Clydaea vesicula]